MKHLKKLSLAFLLTTLFSISFTSCIDTDVDPAVEAIYAAQADLIAAQSAVQNAEAAYLTAQANAEQAAADELAAITARYTAMTIIELEEARAAADLAVEEARIAMLLAQAQFDQDLAQIADAIRTAANAEAGRHATDYATAMSQLSALRGERLTLTQAIADNQLFMQSTATNAEMTWAVYLANLERDVLAKEASVIANEEYIVRANAYLGDYDAMVIALDAANAAVTAKQAEIQALLDEDTQIDTDIAAAGTFDAFQTDYEALLLTLEGDGSETAAPISGLEGNLAFYTTSATTLSTVTIPGLNTTIANYDGTTTTLGGVVSTTATAETNAGGAITTAEAALGTSLGAPSAGNAPSTLTTLYAALFNAQLEKADATAALTTLVGIIAGLEGSLQTAANDLNAAQITYDGGIVAVDALVTSTGAAVSTAQAGVTTAIANYELWRDRFEGGTTVNGGFYWEDTLPAVSVVLGDTVLGTHTDASGAATTSYVRVASWTYNDVAPVGAGPEDTYTPLTIDTAQQATIDGVAELAILGNGTITQGDYVTAYPLAGNTETYFIEVGLDDVSYSNLVQMNLASTALGNEDIFDNPPVFGDGATGDADAYSVLWDAQLAEINALDAQANFGVDLAAKQLIYDDLKAVYEDELNLLDAAQLLEANKIAAIVAPQSAVNTAVTALGTTLGTPIVTSTVSTATTLYAALWNAEIANLIADAALATHLATTVPMYEAQLATAEGDLVTANNMISEINILIVRLTADIAALTAEYEALVATPLYAAQQVRILEIADEIAVLTAEKAVLTTEASALAITIMFEGSGSVAAIDAAIVTAQAVIDGAPAYLAIKAAQIALGEVSVENLQAAIDNQMIQLADLDAEIAAKMIEADGYLALLNEALGN
ncbi:hypothetical protein [uncultured Lutibacter sp.]|uniref:hypothetical protein n=1 Tax=uncultured Lutibacter sp. TaxID=437739 RepID=UPI0026279EA4|nr:hypothetical protein [uncultured Lutibacter sp.]